MNSEGKQETGAARRRPDEAPSGRASAAVPQRSGSGEGSQTALARLLEQERVRRRDAAAEEEEEPPQEPGAPT